MAENEQISGWHLDRRVPVVLILAMMGQIVAGAVFATKLSDQANSNTQDIQEVKEDIKSLTKEEGGIQRRVIRIEERLQGNFRILERIERRLYRPQPNRNQ